MSPTERAIVFECGGEPLVGVLSLPDQSHRLGVVVVVGGPQYRAGSHRQFVSLARALARAGYPVLRFDHRGMGDSGGDPRSFEGLDDDIAAAIAALRREVGGLDRVVLWGLCDGASAALMYAGLRPDPALAGLCLANPWVRSEAGQARTQVRHYYTRRLRERAFWAKLFAGRVSASAIVELARKLHLAVRRAEPQEAPPDYRRRMALAWQEFEGSILLLLSGRDYTAKEFLDAAAVDPAWRDAFAHPGLTRRDFAEADHTFSDKLHANAVERATCEWLDGIDKAPTRSNPAQPNTAARTRGEVASS